MRVRHPPSRRLSCTSHQHLLEAGFGWAFGSTRRTRSNDPSGDTLATHDPYSAATVGVRDSARTQCSSTVLPSARKRSARAAGSVSAVSIRSRHTAARSGGSSASAVTSDRPGGSLLQDVGGTRGGIEGSTSQKVAFSSGADFAYAAQAFHERAGRSANGPPPFMVTSVSGSGSPNS